MSRLPAPTQMANRPVLGSLSWMSTLTDISTWELRLALLRDLQTDTMRRHADALFFCDAEGGVVARNQLLQANEAATQ